MSSSLSEAKVKVDGQRRAIREHVAKHENYPLQQDKTFATKTIRNCQSHIQEELRRYPQIRGSWEDSWKPGDPIH